MKKFLALSVLTVLSLSSAFASASKSCTVDEVTKTALSVGNSLYAGKNFDGIEVSNVDTSHVGINTIETYDLWLTSAKKEQVQIRLGFLVRPAGNAFYGKEGCGLVTASIPFFQAP